MKELLDTDRVNYLVWRFAHPSPPPSALLVKCQDSAHSPSLGLGLFMAWQSTDDGLAISRLRYLLESSMSAFLESLQGAWPLAVGIFLFPALRD